ncbi:MAG: hypothetical protein AB1632_13415, partial [Nitrospirota bacterium]
MSWRIRPTGLSTVVMQPGTDVMFPAAWLLNIDKCLVQIFDLMPFLEIKSGLICNLLKKYGNEILSVFISDVSPLSLDTGGPYKC